MGSTTVRRFVLAAALVLLAPVWSQTSVVAGAAGTPDLVSVGLAPAGNTGTVATRRHPTAGWWVQGSRPDAGRVLVTLAMVALVSALRAGLWSLFEAVRTAASALGRRRHVIALRAPPLLNCA